VISSDLAGRIPPSRMAILWDIIVESDWKDLNMLEEKIYLYGRSLGTRDTIGRTIFTRMAQALRDAQALHNAQNVKTL
jgi:hypothetical protein